MTLFNEQTANLDKALLAVARWPYRKEREEVLKAALQFISAQLGYELINETERK